MVAEQYLPPIETPLPEQARIFPNPGALINSEGKVVGHIDKLFDHQKEGAERIIQAWRERDGFILQDDAGLGKSNTALAALVAQGGRRNLIVVPTMNKDGMMKQWASSSAGGLYGLRYAAAKDLFEGKGKEKVQIADAGLSPTEPGWYLVSYDEMVVPLKDANGEPVKDAKGDAVKVPNPLLQGQWDTITYDECHNMVGKDASVGERARAAIDLADKASKVLYMSATPFTNVCDLHYLTRLGIPGHPDIEKRMFGNSPEEFAKWAEFVGARVEGKVVKNPTSWKPKVRIAATLHTSGATVKRQANLDGMHSKFHQLSKEKLTDEQKHVFDLAEEIFAIGAQGMGESIMGMWNTAWSKAYWEQLKIPSAIAMAKEALAEGKQVAIFTSYKAFNHAHLRKVPEKLAEIAAKLEDNPKTSAKARILHAAAREAAALVDQLPNGTDTVKLLADAFGGSDKVAEIHGATNKKPSDEQKLYQEGRKLVCVATQARGGTGISLHDTIGVKDGGRPRVQINLSLPWSGRAFDQVAGRSHRLGSKSETTVHWMMGDADTERKLASILAKQLRNGNSPTSGDPDIRDDAGMLAAWEHRDAGSSSNSDEEGADVKALEDMTASLQQNDEDKVLDDERLVDIRDAFTEYAQQLSAGRSPLAEAYQAKVQQKAHEAELEHARAAEQIRKHKNWHIRPFEHYGKPGYVLHAYPSALPKEHPNYDESKLSYQNRSSGYKRSTSGSHIIPHGGKWVGHGYWVPQENMAKLSESLGSNKQKIDMRQVVAKENKRAKEEEAAKAAEAEQREALKVAAEKRAVERAERLKGAPVHDKAVAALEDALPKGPDGIGFQARQIPGKDLWHLSERSKDEQGQPVWDMKTREHKEWLKEKFGARFGEYPTDGRLGWTVPKSALPEIAAKFLGHEDWKKSLVIPAMPLDRLLERTRVQMRLTERAAVGDLIWMTEEATDELQGRTRSYVPAHWPEDVLGKALSTEGGWGSIPGGSHGGQRRRTATGWEYRYDNQTEPLSDVVTMYHGTDEAGARGIERTGQINGPAYLTPRKEMARDYNPHVFEVKVPRDRLRHDYSTHPDDDEDIHEWIRRGKSVYTDGPVSIHGGKLHRDDSEKSFVTEEDLRQIGRKAAREAGFGDDVKAWEKWYLAKTLERQRLVFAKAFSHKYIKRTPTGNPRRPWRYWYKLPSGEVVSGDDLKQGARFKAEHMGKVGHFEVQAHDAERGLVHVKHDESGKEAHIREADLKRMVQGYHAKQKIGRAHV